MASVYGAVAGAPDDTSWMRSVAYASLHAVASGWLVISGVTAAFSDPSRTGGLALAINTVAAVAYALLALNRLTLGVSTPRAFAARNAVRSVDWLCTFPAMQVEVLLLLGLRPSTNSMEFVLVPVLAALVVGIDLLLRVAFVRVANAPRMWIGGQVVASGLFVAMVAVLVTATPAVTSDDRTTTLFFVYVWCMYPAVAFVSDGVRWGAELNPELVEDLAFTLLDVVSKAGLATYVALRHS